MDQKLFKVLNQQGHIPSMNPVIMDGFVKQQIPLVEQYVDYAFRSAARHFSPDLKYHGIVRCTPEESCREAIRKRNTYELSRSDVYLVRAVFSHNGKMLRPRYLYLPYVDKDGCMRIRDVRYYIAPIMADPCASVNKDGIFVPILQANPTFKKISYQIKVDGEFPPACYVVWSQIHNKFQVKQGRANTYSTMAHYLFCKYGVTGAFKKYANADVVVDTRENRDQYPSKDWVICESRNLTPQALRGNRNRRHRDNYIGTDLILAIPRPQYEAGEMPMLMAAGFFYVVDHFPDKVKPGYVDHSNLWYSLMGRIIFKNDQHVGKLIDNIGMHMSSLDTYMDDLSIQYLKMDGIEVSDIYDLFAKMMEIVPERIIKTDVSSLYGKRLIIPRYLLSDIVSSIFYLRYKLGVPRDKPLSENEINTHMNMQLKAEKILSIPREHGEVVPVSMASDCRIPNMTNVVVQQTNSTKRTGGSKTKSALGDPNHFMHVSVVEICSYANLPKAAPHGRDRLNPYAMVDPDGVINRDPKKLELLDALQEMLKR